MNGFKNIGFMFLFFGILIGFIAQASAMELLVKTSDNVLSASPKQFWTDEMFKEERAGNSKQGYVVTAKPDGYSWGYMEKDPRDVVIVRIPDEEWNASWLEPEYDYTKPINGGYEILTERKYKFPLESFLTEQEIDNSREWPCDGDESSDDLKPIIKEVSDSKNKVKRNVWEEKSFDRAKQGDPSCEYYASLGKWSVVENAIVGFPQYNGKREKVLVLNQNVNLTSESINIQFPENTSIISTNLSWDGNITLPETIEEPSIDLSMEMALMEAEVSEVVEMGFANVKLNLDRGAKISFPNQAGSSVGYIRNGEFYEISTACESNTQEYADSLNYDGDCKIDDRLDLVVWTKHFTEFVIYKESSSTENLQLYLPFNGNSNDESGNGNNGIVYGAVLTTDKDGNPNSAYYFDGTDDYIDLGTSLFALNDTNEFTLSMWVNSEKIIGTKGLLSRGQYNNPFFFQLNNGKILSGVRTTSSYYLYSNQRLNVNNWYYLTYSFKNGERRIYINGQIDRNDTLSGTLIKNLNQQTTIGRTPNNVDYFNGKIDEVRIYNKALSESEVEELYLGIIIPECSQDSECNDGLYCNGVETCSVSGQCVDGNAISCSINNLLSIGTCNNDPDNNPLTWDFRSAFTSICDEDLDSCKLATSEQQEISHTCDVLNCNAQCDATHSCSITDCDYLDGCVGYDYYDYGDVNNLCLNNCNCENNVCEEAVIYHNDTKCVGISTENLQLYLSFNGNSNDESGNGNNGIVYGAVLTTDKDGNPNSAYYFDGTDDYIDLGTSLFNINDTNEFALSMWVNPENVVGTKGLLSRGQYNTPFLLQIVNGGGIRTGLRTTNTFYLNSNQRLNINNWYYLTYSFKNGERRVYINGQINRNDTFSGTLAKSIQPTTIGRTPNTADYFLGTIDEVRIYNRALSESEVEELYNQ